ncbi:progranulin-like isoform X2 [Scleropages formosus]|uniref:Granulins domain-containing protein n=2 Tax=Scleropages formosus TaxID=113540 RepID=A0A8C9T2E9_SCLFO|nr:progranulin isoform X2 [Scleropages formosus]
MSKTARVSGMNHSLMWTSALACLSLLALTWTPVCADAVHCDDGSIPCLSASGVYGCCALPNDLSVSDDQCAEGYQHGPDGTTCIKKEGHAEAIICPDGESECPDETTCCQLPDSSWGCCPMVEAVCCEDRRHCCPQGTKCDIAHSKCVSPTLEETLMYRKFPAKRRVLSEERVDSAGTAASITCPDGKSQCPEGTTCCQMTSGSYGCCPFPNAVCCTDHLHCCPGNTTCDLEHQVCVSADGQTPLARRFPPVLRVVVCPDQVSHCPDETTCCMLNNGSYGCCPLPRAVCCSDHLHCCPEGTTCDLAHSTCVSPSGSTNWAHKLPARRGPPAESTVGVVPCNNSVACPDDTTCCKTERGQWACCPYSQAVCCSDHIHCCPQNTVCNLSAGSCDTSMSSMSWLDRVASSSWTASKAGSKCDSTASCSRDETCCKSSSGAWACCPLPQAVCCEDHVHCCPHGTVCNLAAQTCDDPSGSLPWLEKVPAITTGSLDEKCDEQSVCPSGTTCCQQNSGHWACCPLPHAVCCDDHEHCCPKGYKCDVSQETCERPDSLSLPWFRKRPALQKDGPTQAVDSSPVPTEGNQCDAHTNCPRDNTCCYMKKLKKWGCCPLPKAVCCENGEHCCPHGYRCDPGQSSCDRGDLVIPWYRKVEALSSTALPKDVKCDTETSCAAGTTCCRLPTGQWGCCPLVKAVCCADHEHCCPQGYTCNMKAGTCEKDGRPQDVPVSRVSPPDSKDPQCSGCSDGETCCRTSGNTWACCPSPKAVCCSDMKHCCPTGYSCDPAAGSCSRTQEQTWHSLTALEQRAFIPV